SHGWCCRWPALPCRRPCGVRIACPSALALLVRRMAVEGARGGEFAELHADHVLIDRHRHKLAAVVDIEGEADELRQDRRTARPSLDRRALAVVLRGFRFLQKRKLDERTFPDGTGHGLTLLLRVTRPDDELVGRFVVTSASTLGRLASGGNRVTAARGA